MVKQTINIKNAYEMIDECAMSIDTAHHAVELHLFQSDELLKNRIIVEKTTGASCFYISDAMELVEMMQDIVYDSSDIVKWVMATEIHDDLRIVVEKESVGKKFTSTMDWSNGSEECHKIALIVGKEYDKFGYLDRLRVKSCYPF